MFEDEVEGFLQELRMKGQDNPNFFPTKLLIEDEGWQNQEDLKRILLRLDVGIYSIINQGVILDIEVIKNEFGDIQFIKDGKEFDFHHLYFILRRNGMIRIDTMQVVQ